MLGASIDQLFDVVQIDPVAMAAILRVTGPVSIPAWPEPITAANISEVAQNTVYFRYTAEADRDTFGQQLLDAAVTALKSRPFVLDDATSTLFA